MTIGLPAPWRLDWQKSGRYPGGSLQFGTWGTPYLMTKMPTIDEPDRQSDSLGNARRDGQRFGKDFLGGSTITFELEANGSDEDDARSAASRFRSAWRSAAVRLTPGAVATLTAHTGRQTFGRPQGAPVDYQRAHQGRGSYAPEFLAADDLWYDPEDVEIVTLVTGTEGGLVAPLVAPLLTTASSDRSRVFEVGGEEPTWPVIKIRGPIINPAVSVVGRFRFGFETTLAFDEYIEIDTRTWSTSILRNGTSGIATDSTSDLIRNALLTPGRYELSLRGTATGGNPTAQVAWRNAYASY